jgi:hypothetical protein
MPININPKHKIQSTKLKAQNKYKITIFKFKNLFCPPATLCVAFRAGILSFVLGAFII